MRDILYLVGDNGEAASVFVHALPQAETPGEGTPLHKVSPLPDGSRLCALFALPPREERSENQFVLSCTSQGLVKKSAITELPPPAARPFTLVKVNEEDTLGWARLTDGQADVTVRYTGILPDLFSEGEAAVAKGKLNDRRELEATEVLAKHDENYTPPEVSDTAIKPH